VPSVPQQVCLCTACFRGFCAVASVFVYGLFQGFLCRSKCVCVRLVSGVSVP